MQAVTTEVLEVELYENTNSVARAHQKVTQQQIKKKKKNFGAQASAKQGYCNIQQHRIVTTLLAQASPLFFCTYQNPTKQIFGVPMERR